MPNNPTVLNRDVPYEVVTDSAGAKTVMTHLHGDALLNFPVLNKGTAFTDRERNELGLRGILPPRVTSMAEQSKRVMYNYRRKSSDLDRYIHLISLMDRNETLFYRVLVDNLEEMMPIVYTPTVGEACREFGRVYRRHRGLYITPDDRGRVREVLRNWPLPDVRVIVVTDGERILGLGDLGESGMGIPIGKLSLYAAAGGLDPAQLLPICIDVGTERGELRGDDLYLGRNSTRLRGPEYYSLIDEFVWAVQDVFPKALIQFEDFSHDTSFPLLDEYQNKVLCFNDDIQGTAAVTVSAVMAAERITGRKMSDERFLIAGGGSAGAGIARQLVAYMKAVEGTSEAEAKKTIWMTDSKGLITTSRPTPLDEHKKEFAREGASVPLEQATIAIKPTVLIGVSGVPGLFNETILKNLGERPLVMPLSNPTKMVECTPEEARRATSGKALVATGSPFPETSQCNNVYIFPGIGLSAACTGFKRIDDEMFLVAAKALAEKTPQSFLDKGLLLPPLTEIRAVSRGIAVAVAKHAGKAPNIEQWQPDYLPYKKA